MGIPKCRRRKASSCPFGLAINHRHPDLDGMTPLAVASLGQEGADRANRLLHRLIERRDEERARNAENERWKSETEREIFELLRDRTQPFLDSPFALGSSGKKAQPRGYFVSKETFEFCLKLATSIAKKKRPTSGRNLLRWPAVDAGRPDRALTRDSGNRGFDPGGIRSASLPDKTEQGGDEIETTA
jgi:hypothetical protein